MEKKEVRLFGEKNNKYYHGEKEISASEFSNVMVKRSREDGSVPFDGVVFHPDVEGDEDQWVIEDGKQESKYGPVRFFCDDRPVSKDEFIEEVAKAFGVKLGDGILLGVCGLRAVIGASEGVAIAYYRNRAIVDGDERKDGEKEEGR